jgi:phage host-nuclease inhibitor protein Gam
MTNEELEKIVFQKEEEVQELLKSAGALKRENTRLYLWLCVNIVIIIALVAASAYALTGSIL